MRKKATQRKLIDAAKCMMSTRGTANISTEEICATAEVSRRSVFHHFDTIDALKATACHEWLMDIRALLRERTLDATTLELVTLLVRSMIEPTDRGFVLYLLSGFGEDTCAQSLREALKDVFVDCILTNRDDIRALSPAAKQDAAYAYTMQILGVVANEDRRTVDVDAVARRIVLESLRPVLS